MINYVLSIRRRHKQVLILLVDTLLVIVALWVAFSLRYGEAYDPSGDEIWLWVMAPVLAIPVFLYFSLYQTIIRYIGFVSLWKVFQAISLYSLIWGVCAFLSGIQIVPRSVVMINWLTCLLLVGGARMMARWLLTVRVPGILGMEPDNRKNVLIYGAGAAGMQLAISMSYSREMRPVAFLDDQFTLKNQQVNGLHVYHPDETGQLIDKFDVQDILLAMPSASQHRRHEILASLEPYPVPIHTLPDISELESCEVDIRDIRGIDISDLLDRDAVAPIDGLLHADITGKVVMVTGAGGSIGSELSRQISQLNPKRLVLFDHSEFNLYQLERELVEQDFHAEISLGSVLDKNRLSYLCRYYGVQTIYHAAAYKHVPLVEKNPLIGAVNNVMGTRNCALAAIDASVTTFVLVSTDKAVRPANIMGATKRLAELLLQDLSQRPQMKTRFTMVRFGNVLDSSGSVVPLFRDQIQRGGPVTVTHPEIIRYFMTIKEATQLVLQAGAMGEGGDVFVLDMGEPVSIVNLAKKMIRLSGLDIKENDYPENGIEIEFLGLRDGEKLFEELLISESSVPTFHPRIMREVERAPNLVYLEKCLEDLQESIEANDEERIKKLLFEMVETYNPDV
ncbi:MAG: NAD-dependent epimerase/dehydratase family protein [Gammaproteobacteria bacterium]|nr:NAD-dependent epimerase/dehydratase family protein [Gammaproteobacteria bacterium]